MVIRGCNQGNGCLYLRKGLVSWELAIGQPTGMKVGKAGSSDLVQACRQACNLTSFFLFLERTVRPICFRERAVQFPSPPFVIAALWHHVCAKGLSAATWLEHRPVQGEVELSSRLQASSLPWKSSKNCSFFLALCLCFWWLPLSPPYHTCEMSLT